MAGCYHDKQDFKSNLNIEVAREDDILEAGQDLDEVKCNKNPGHRGFIPFKDLALTDLPIEIRDIQRLDTIKKMGSRVVRLVVKKRIKRRSMTTQGTGYVYKFENEYFVHTNNHVVKTDGDVKNCTVQFHYDDKDESGVFTSRGVKLDDTCPYRDITFFKFQPIPDFLHQLDWVYEKLTSIVILYTNNQIEIEKIMFRPRQCLPLKYLISPLDLNSSEIDVMFISCEDGSISYIKSSYFRFKPIPFSRPLFTAIEILFCYRISSIKIEIHIDEDGGNSRAMPGDVVKLGDAYVVKTPESIFQDEVKKCRLVWNGEVIGCGTRLYFPQVKISDISLGIDSESEGSIDILWECECYPIPRMIEDMQQTVNVTNMCCIGHPHGGIKMVTFGRYLGDSIQRFDNLYRRIDHPDPDCQCKEVPCVQYSAKTCPGSSGSPVFSLKKNHWLTSSIHFLGERVNEFFTDGELIENINTAWG